MSQKQKGGADRKQEEKPGGGRSRGDPGRRAAAEGGEESRSLRWRINQLEKEKLKLTSSCNQEVRRRRGVGGGAGVHCISELSNKNI